MSSRLVARVTAVAAAAALMVGLSVQPAAAFMGSGYTAGDTIAVPVETTGRPRSDFPYGDVKEVTSTPTGGGRRVIDALDVVGVGILTFTATSWIMQATGITESDAEKCRQYVEAGLGSCGDGGYELFEFGTVTDDPDTWGPTYTRVEPWHTSASETGRVYADFQLTADASTGVLTGTATCVSGQSCTTVAIQSTGYHVWCSGGSHQPSAGTYGRFSLNFDGSSTSSRPVVMNSINSRTLFGCPAGEVVVGWVIGPPALLQSEFGFTCSGSTAVCADLSEPYGWVASGLKMAWGTKVGVKYSDGAHDPEPGRPIIEVERNCGAKVIKQTSVVDPVASQGVGIPACPDGSVPGTVTTTLTGIRKPDGTTIVIEDAPTQTVMEPAPGLKLMYKGLPVDSWDTRLTPGQLRHLWDTETDPSFSGTHELSCTQAGSAVLLKKCKPIVNVLAPPTTATEAPPVVTPATPTAPQADSLNCDGAFVGFNPISWVVTPVKCALEWAFVPDAWPDWGSVPSPLPTGWIPVLEFDASGACGPIVLGSLNLGPLLSDTGAREIVDTCDAPWPTVRTVTYYGLLASVLVGVGMRAFRAVMLALGMHVDAPAGGDEE